MEKENSFKPSNVFMDAYAYTLEKAANSKYGKSDFRCDLLECKACPFNCCSDDCTNPYFEDGAGFDRTFEQWQDWFYKLTGEKDDRPKEIFMKKDEEAKQPKQETQINEDKEANEDNTEKVSYQTAKEIAGNYTLGNIANVAQTNFKIFTKELEAKAKSKYEVEYLDLDSDEPRTKYVRNVVDLLFLIIVWNDEAIKWNLIANGNISKIPHDFKDIYIKVYDPEEGVIIFQDEHTLKSKGLKLVWTRDN